MNHTASWATATLLNIWLATSLTHALPANPAPEPQLSQIAQAQAKKKSGVPPSPALAPPAAAPAEPPPPTPQPPAAPTKPVAPPEKVEADVSTRTVAVTTQFTGTEIIVFGSVTNGRQETAEAGYYDVVILVEGSGAPSIVRLKDQIGGLWVNAAQVRFDGLPLYSAIASTRPIEEIAEPRTLVTHGIGFGRARMFPGVGSSPTTAQELDNYKSAAIRLKQRDGLYVRQDTGVVFRGSSLFRANIKLPANIPVGPLEARVYLFREGKMLSSNMATVRLERQGFERLVYDFAFEYPFWYGLLAVITAAAAGLTAAAIFQRPTS
jgi:uncharacterized protein (TIGR02186 family)